MMIKESKKAKFMSKIHNQSGVKIKFISHKPILKTLPKSKLSIAFKHSRHPEFTLPFYGHVTMQYYFHTVSHILFSKVMFFYVKIPCIPAKCMGIDTYKHTIST